MHESGFTDRRLAPQEDKQLLSLGYGLTNLVERATVAAAELSGEELKAGAARLEEQVRQFRPAWISFLGIGAYRSAFNRPTARIGLQEETIADASIWVLPNQRTKCTLHTQRFGRGFSRISSLPRK
jgi:double-stranded uracil-DNA glycosylase